LVVVGIGCPAASVLRSLLALDLFPGLYHLLAELGKQGVFFSYGGYSGRAYVEAAAAIADGVLFLLVWRTAQDQLYGPTWFTIHCPFD